MGLTYLKHARGTRRVVQNMYNLRAHELDSEQKSALRFEAVQNLISNA